MDSCGLSSVLRTVVICFILFWTSTGQASDNCDWVGSGILELALSRGVQPVYLRCNQGKVRWFYPRGALRVVLEHRSTGGSFAACIRRAEDSAGARIYLAGRRKLQPVFRLDDPADMVRCVMARGGRVALYVEADPVTNEIQKLTTEFSYHLNRVDGKSLENDIDEDCKPCSAEELLHQYCSSDFVFQGSVASLYHDTRLQQTELTVRLSNVHRDSGINRFTERSESAPKYVVLKRPLKCGTKAGSGEYLFTGNWVLRNPTLNCAPRISEWKKVRRKAMEQGLNECMLKL